MNRMTSDQKRCHTLAFRCYTGFSMKDKTKKNPIPEGKALEDWKELLEKRFPQRSSGGTAFVLKIANVVKNKKTEKGLDLTAKNAILEHLAKWCERMCQEHNIDPGSQVMQALEQQSSWHEEQMNGRAISRESLARIEATAGRIEATVGRVDVTEAEADEKQVEAEADEKSDSDESDEMQVDAEADEKQVEADTDEKQVEEDADEKQVKENADEKQVERG